MKFNPIPVLVGIATLSMFSNAIASDAQSTLPNTNQNTSANTYYSGYWQPQARINPIDPIQVLVVNQTNFPLNFGLTTNQLQVIQPSSNSTLSTNTLPANLFIYPTVPQVSLKYTLSAVDNLITIAVEQTSSATSGNQSIWIGQTGGVYVQ
ncbi:MAG: hypothetical protein KME10_26590 [Plectolyngbya sp. WJT66-NPBG17]|jgi:hypothetical protein|nr:hypothetical protein [Plectolyngbya sp. WJT66-NPBG17]